MPEELIIKISLSSEGDGYNYDIYLGDDKYMDGDSEDGGFCTTTLENALEMATEQVKQLINNK